MIDGTLWPEWIDGSNQVVERLQPISCQIEISIEDMPKATLQIAPDQTIPGVHEYIRLYTADGSAGVYRVVSSSRKYGQAVTLQLLGVADTLTDDLYRDRADEKESKTASAWITDILSWQAVQRWQAGTCALSANVELQTNYQTLWDLLEQVRTAKQGYYWDFDTSTWPWTLNLRALPAEITCGFAITRNIESIQTQVSDADLFNRLYVAVTEDGETTVTTYNDAASQSAYGLRERTTEIKGDELPTGMTAAEYGQMILDMHKQPVVAIQISGYDLHRLTGDDYDKIRLGTLCTVSAEGMTNLSERVVSMTWPDVYGDPDRVTVSLNTIIPPITGSLGAAAKIAQAVKGAGGGGGKSGDEKGWSKVLTKTIEAVDGTGISELWQSGIQMTAMGGVRIFSLRQGMEAADAEIKVNADNIDLEVTRATQAEGQIVGALEIEAGKIAMVVGTRDGNNFIKAAEIATELNATTGEGIAWINADHINISGTSTAHALAGEVEYDANGRLVIKSAGGMYVRRTDQGITSEFGVWDNGNLTGGVMVSQINGQPGTKLTLAANVIDIQGLVAAIEAQSGWFTDFDGFNGEFTGDLTVGGILSSQDELRANEILAALVDTDALTVDSTAAAWHSIYVGTTEKAKFLGTADVTFNIALTGTWNNNVYTVTNDLDTSVTASTTLEASNGTWGWDPNDSMYKISVSVRADNAARLTWDVDGVTPYKGGYNQAIDDATSGTYLSGYTRYSSTATTLYYQYTEDGVTKYAAATGEARMWYYGGSTVTRYTLPAKKT